MADITRYDIFEWDPEKEKENIAKHNVDFFAAASSFYDPNQIIKRDTAHSLYEIRWLGIGKAGDQIFTVQFTYRGFFIRIIGAGNWRKGGREYEKENSKKQSG